MIIPKVKSHYIQSFNYLKEHWQWCFLSVMLFTEFFIFSCLNTSPSNHYEHYVAETMPQYGSLFAFIFWENLENSLFMILFGTIPFGFGVLFSTYMVCTNFVSTAKWLLPTVGIRKLILCTLPHGIFEISAMIFSVILSVLWCRAVSLFVIRLIRKEPAISFLTKEILCITKCIIFVEFPLTLCGTILEITISQFIFRILA